MAGDVSGSICKDLCVHENFHFAECLSTVPAKKIFGAIWREREVVVKINMSWFEGLEKRQEFAKGKEVKSYENDISTRVRALFGDCARCGELVSFLVSIGDSDNDGEITGAEERSFMSLLQQNEAMMLMALNNSEHTVDFYGYCAGLYVLEKVPHVTAKVFEEKWELIDLSFLPEAVEPIQTAIDNLGGIILQAVFSFLQYLYAHFPNYLPMKINFMLHTFLATYVPSKREKFRLAYSLIDATLELSNNPYGLVISCDANLHNFGYTSNFLVKFIDLDLTYPLAFVKSLLKKKNCTCDSDCWTGVSEICCSACNTTTGYCTSEMQYQDLHIVCEAIIPKIFSKRNIRESDDTCLTNAIHELDKYCSRLPVVYTVEELKLEIHAVKKRLRSIETSNKC